VEVNNTITTLSSFNRDKEVQSRGLRREQKKITECITQATKLIKWVLLISKEKE